MNKKIAEQLVSFYRILLEVIQGDKFDKTVAESLVATYQELKLFLTIPECTLVSIRRWRTEYYGTIQPMDAVSMLAECAFTDLAFQLRNPEVQHVIETYLDVSGTSSTEDIYVQIRNVRLLGEVDGGPAVVTLIVDSFSTFTEMLKNLRGPIYSHYSISRKAIKAAGSNMGFNETAPGHNESDD